MEIPNATNANDYRAAHNLSKRGAWNAEHRDVWGPREKSMANPWSPENPDGTVILRLAENSLMHDDVTRFFSSQMRVLPVEHLTYSIGPRGSRRLRNAAARLMSEDFHSTINITADNLFVTPGLASAIDALAWAICDEGEGILIPQPYYNGFDIDILNRSNAKVIGVPYANIPGYTTLEDLFKPEINRLALNAALRDACQRGITIRALIISNPHNPLGRCYPPETLHEFASFCGRHRLHFISDEIYAKSVFHNPAMSNPTPFTSVLSLDTSKTIDPKLLHVLYGASKDFCANGLRLGLVCTQNQGIIGAMSSISIFSWSSHIIQDVWAAMLEDKRRLETFMTEKLKLMEKNYAIATSLLRQYGISYLEMNAGLFIWIDLPTTDQRNTASVELVPNELKETEFNEKCVLEECLSNGVMIAPGSVYHPERSGSFRITFTLDQCALEEGLKRLRISMNNLQAS